MGGMARARVSRADARVTLHCMAEPAESEGCPHSDLVGWRPVPASRALLGLLTVLAMLLSSVVFAPIALAAPAAPAVGAPGVAGAPMTAMIVGDSLTQGSAGDFTWR